MKLFLEIVAGWLSMLALFGIYWIRLFADQKVRLGEKYYECDNTPVVPHQSVAEPSREPGQTESIVLKRVLELTIDAW